MTQYRKRDMDREIIKAEQFKGGDFLEEIDFADTFAYAGDLSSLTVETPYCPARACPGDYVVRHEDGTHTVWAPRVFGETYERMGD